MIEREQLEMDVVFVGAGPANLAAALHLKNKITEHDEMVENGLRTGRKIGELEIGIIEKGAFVGAHILSGAVMDPIALRELMPDFLEQGCPIDSVVTGDAFWYLTEDKKIKSPITPPPLKNEGKYLVSLSRICEWLAEKCEEAGINIFPEFPGEEILFDEQNRVIGVRTGDKGIDKDGKPKGNFEPGVDLLAKVTVLGEGSRGSLTKHLTQRLGLKRRQRAAGFLARRKGIVGSSGRQYRRRLCHSHARFSVRHRHLRRRLDLRNAGKPCEHRLCYGLGLQRPDDRSASRISKI